MAHTILYYDCFSGVSGDMNLGAMIDLGVKSEDLERELSKLGIDGYRLEIFKDERKGITGTRVIVHTEEAGHLPEAVEHTHEHHHHRGLTEIKKIITDSQLSATVKHRAIAIFERLGLAEAKVHGVPVEQVHFHEVGAIDAIVDIVGAAICLDLLAVDRVECSEVRLGGGTVRAAHGLLPVPAPATAEILRDVPVRSGPVDKELTTPTGAAIVRTLAEAFDNGLTMSVQAVGYGIGGNDNEVANVLRVFLGQSEAARVPRGNPESGDYLQLETNIDDMLPEDYDYVVERLFELGAQDVWLTPIIMKKTRPAITLSCLCSESRRDACIDVLLSETSSLGVRVSGVSRPALERSSVAVDCTYGTVRVKIAYKGGAVLKVKPEYEDCRELAQQHGVTVQAVRTAALNAYHSSPTNQSNTNEVTP
ncbi:MAG: nickel pincer cofactor biosynthesis protein LarC [Spirochaetaceae bacterium]|nr:MAG: nickel pincer cofactor biosynthesis protein LarC [Spirochaetaceae bacterium]